MKLRIKRLGGARDLAGAAFSLTEVVLALGIAAFALVALVGLLPVGFKIMGDSDSEGQAMRLLGSVIADRRASPFDSPSLSYQLPALSGASAGTGSFDVTDAGERAVSPNEPVRFRVHYRIVAPATNSQEPYRVWFGIGKPVSTPNDAVFFETVTTFFRP